METLNRRRFVQWSALGLAGAALGGAHRTATAAGEKAETVSNGIKKFICSVANDDGSFRPGVDPDYKGNSDTRLSGIAAPAYAVMIAETFGWSLPDPEATREFFLSLQKPDGAFIPHSGSLDPHSPHARLYNTAQSLVALHFLGAEPKHDAEPVIRSFLNNSVLEELPLYTTSFFPYFYNALGKPMPRDLDRRIRAHIKKNQGEDGYIADHVASTFHAAHYYRLAGDPTPKAEEMVERVLRDQKEDGSWHLHPPDWDVHASYDALFILRQLGDPKDKRIKGAYEKAVQYVLTCQNEDGGFGHYPGKTSDVDAVFFQAGTLAQAGFLAMNPHLKDEEMLGWGHAMKPGKKYSCLAEK